MNTPVVAGGTLIEARDVHKSFGQTPALRGASVAVSRGEIQAIMGPSGSGKSTLLHCLAGIFAPDNGEVWFDGSRMDALDEAARTKLRRTAFGFVFQFGQLVPELTAADNVAMPLLLNRVRRRTADRFGAAILVRRQVLHDHRPHPGRVRGRPPESNRAAAVLHEQGVRSGWGASR